MFKLDLEKAKESVHMYSAKYSEPWAGRGSRRHCLPAPGKPWAEVFALFQAPGSGFEAPWCSHPWTSWNGRLASIKPVPGDAPGLSTHSVPRLGHPSITGDEVWICTQAWWRHLRALEAL